MNPLIELISEKDDTLQFTLSGVNVSLSNAIRRIILSEIPILVFKTSPYEQNKANILVNTSRLNNEILKQRLSCIPIHIRDIDSFPLSNYQLEVNVENNTDTVMYVTTKDFLIKDLVVNKYLSEAKTREIFPPDDYTGYYIDFVRLRPKLSDELPGEKVHLTCDFSISSAKDDSMFNVVSTCSYGFTPDLDKMDAELAKKKQAWKDEGKNEKEIDFEAKNWKLLDGLRIVKPDSFDFTLKTVGIYSNSELLDTANSIMIQKLNDLDKLLETDELTIEPSKNTMSNCYDIILENEDYTLGKAVEYMLYTKFYEGTKVLSFCGFKKMHPHDSQSIIRLAYFQPSDPSVIKQHLKECIVELLKIYQKMQKEFLKLMKN
jgi:DNA-directed RNA polymerase alpha subunit